MRHTAHGDAYAHDPLEVIQLLIQEAGCETDEVYHLEIVENASSRPNGAKKFCAAIVEESSEEYVLYVEGDSEGEVQSILDEAKIKAREDEE